LPVGLYTQGAAGRALSAAIEAARGGASHIAAAIYPVAITLYRPSAEALAETLTGLGMDTGVDLDTLWSACSVVDDALESDAAHPLSPRVAVRAARHGIPAAVVDGIDDALRAQGLSDRLDEVLEELEYVRAAAGWPPLVAPIGQILGSQALVHVLAAQRWTVLVDDLPGLLAGRYGEPPRPVAPEALRAVELRGADALAELARLDELRVGAEGLAASEEELLLLALFGDDAEPLLRAIRARAAGAPPESEVERQTADRIRELIDIVQESGIGEVTIEEGEMRVTVRRGDEHGAVVAAPVIPSVGDGRPEPVEEPTGPPPEAHLVVVESPMVGTFYRAPQPGAPPFVEVGDVVGPGQTLCILEAMKLMNELKAEVAGVVRTICVENAEPVEYGQLLFEIEPAGERPIDAL
jgi:oxaloacetate decarboxylase alpha subunit